MKHYKIKLSRIILFLFTVSTSITLSACKYSEKAAFDADMAMDSYIKAFYYEIDGSGFLNKHTDGGQQGFWSGAEIIEVFEDAYDRTKDEKYKDMIVKLCDGFINKFGTDWTSNIYNDDIMWMVLVCIRAYNITGDEAYKDLAKYHFDQVLARGCDKSLDGGIWWTTDNHEKNSCITDPAVIAAVRLYEALKDDKYLSMAKELYSWETNILFDSDTGSVYDNIKIDKKVEKNNYTYNQGTFIGASCELYKATKDSKYLENAKKAADYTIKNMCNDGILKDEGDYGDGSGFKGIFTRYIKTLVTECGQDQYTSWFVENANTVWKNRRAKDNLLYANWNTKCPEGILYAFASSTGVALLQNCPQNK